MGSLPGTPGSYFEDEFVQDELLALLTDIETLLTDTAQILKKREGKLGPTNLELAEAKLHEADKLIQKLKPHTVESDTIRVRLIQLHKKYQGLRN